MTDPLTTAALAAIDHTATLDASLVLPPAWRGRAARAAATELAHWQRVAEDARGQARAACHDAAQLDVALTAAGV